jgi:hypothetical protein
MITSKGLREVFGTKKRPGHHDQAFQKHNSNINQRTFVRFFFFIRIIRRTPFLHLPDGVATMIFCSCHVAGYKDMIFSSNKMDYQRIIFGLL